MGRWHSSPGEATGKFTHYFYDPTNPLGPSTNLAEYFRESRDGAIWFASFNGLNRYDEQGGRFQLLLRSRDCPACAATSQSRAHSRIVRAGSG